MNRNNNTSPNQQVPEDTAGLMSMTDSDDSSSSSNAQIFDNQALVLELHELQKDELPDNPLPEVKTRKLSKKRTKRGTEQVVASLSSSTESLVLSTGQPEPPSEEYFDAQGSNHDISVNGLAAPSSLATPETDQDRSKTIPPPPSQEDPSKTIPPTSPASTAIIPAPALTAETAAQLDTTSQQTGSSNPAQQQTGPLSKPTEPSKP